MINPYQCPINGSAIPNTHLFPSDLEVDKWWSPSANSKHGGSEVPNSIFQITTCFSFVCACAPVSQCKIQGHGQVPFCFSPAVIHPRNGFINSLSWDKLKTLSLLLPCSNLSSFDCETERWQMGDENHQVLADFNGENHEKPMEFEGFPMIF